MGSRKTPTALKRNIAIAAARLLAEHQCPDYASARAKAARQCGCDAKKHLPDNQEIETALIEYQQLFKQNTQPAALNHLRQTAVIAMEKFSDFEPSLIGPVLNGSADRYTPITLQLFCDPLEQAIHRLMELNIPWQQTEVKVHYPGKRVERRSLISFHAGDEQIELLVLPLADLRNPPLNPLNGRPEKGAPLSRVRALIA